jgi:hypothetical protein
MSNGSTEPPDDPWAALEQAATRPPVVAGKRERIVLAQRRSSRRVVRTLTELEEQSGVGEMILRQHMRTQLSLAIRLMLLTVLVLGGVPVAFLLAPSLGSITVIGLRLPWLLLGFAVYPFFVAVAWLYTRSADHNEQDFADSVES